MSTKFEDLIGRGLDANKPTAGVPGRLYFSTDTDRLYRDNGTSWDEYESSTGAASIGARAYNSSAISLTNNAMTAISFDSEIYDTDTIHDTSTNTGRLTCKTAGVYLIVANIAFAAHNTGQRLLNIKHNGTTVLAEHAQPASNDGTATSMSLATIYPLEMNDYVELFVRQKSGGALDLVSAAHQSPEFMMHKIG